MLLCISDKNKKKFIFISTKISDQQFTSFNYEEFLDLLHTMQLTRYKTSLPLGIYFAMFSVIDIVHRLAPKTLITRKEF